MSTLTVTTIKTIDNLTDFTAQSGNTDGGKVVVLANSSGVVLQGNNTSSSNAVYVNSEGFFMGTSTANIVANSSAMRVSRATSNLQLSTSSLFIGNSISNTLVNTSVLFIGNSTSGYSNTGGSAGSNGFTILPNGFKMNWGTVVANSVGQNVITYSSPFTTNTYTLSFTVAGSGATVLKAFANASTINSTGVTVLTGNATALNNTNITSVYYMAIGPA